MSHITRDDGVNFVIPSYRDVLTVKSKKAVQGEVISLGKRYGDYLAMQRKSQVQYDVAFSPDGGYLLGESVWQHFNKPVDMIYCESIANTTEVILVIVKGGNVYLDGNFPVDSVQDELLIFLTQQNEFEIYTYGNVPISETQQDGKFCFDASSVKSFKVLDESAFKNLALIDAYQLKLIDITLHEHGIGSLPVKQLAIVLSPIILIMVLVIAIITLKPEPQEVQIEPNPYQLYVDQMVAPYPDQLIEMFVDKLQLLYSAPGWYVATIKYQSGEIAASMKSSGSSIESLMAWSDAHGLTVRINPSGVFVAANIDAISRQKPKLVYPTTQTLAIFLDRLAKVYPGNNVSLEIIQVPRPVSSYSMKIAVTGLTPMTLRLIGEQTKGLPLILEDITLSSPGALLEGRIILRAMGK